MSFKSKESILPNTSSYQDKTTPTLLTSTIPGSSTLAYVNFHQENSVLYEVEKEISSPATKVFFVHGPIPYTNIQLCLKVWEPCDNGLYSTKNLVKCTEYLLEGLEFNRKFAKDVHLGIAPVEKLDQNFIKCGKLIVNPDKDILEKNVKYALVMKRLDQNWRLDYQLTLGSLGTENGITFLANEIARMHQNLGEALDNIGNDKSILSKLRLNQGHFKDALQIFYDKQINIEQYERYQQITKIMDEAFEKHQKLFQKRKKEHHIKRCHGDLKTANLWVCPSCDGKKEENQLLVLDCVDFNPDFCNIDTISDVAMLAIDIEMHLPNWLDESTYTHLAKKPSEHFLDSYLEAMKEKKRKIKNILQYYLTEKALIYTYMSIKFDEYDDDNGKKYLDLALFNALKLTNSSIFSVIRPEMQIFKSLERKLVEFREVCSHVMHLSFASGQFPKKTRQDLSRGFRRS